MMTRREFLSLLAVAGLAPSEAWAAAPAPVSASAVPGASKRLALVSLRGGLDGLSLAPPLGDAALGRLRPGLVLSRPGMPGGALQGDGAVGLHPALSVLLPFWEKGELAVVAGIGPAKPGMTHPEAQALADGMTETPGNGHGWLNRLLRLLPGAPAPLRGVAVGASMPPALKGAAPASTVRAGNFAPLADKVDPPALYQAWERLYAADARLGPVFAKTLGHMRQEQKGLENEMRAAHTGGMRPESFPDAARALAKALAGEARVGFAAVAGFDTHVAQGAGTGVLAERLELVAKGLHNLVAGLGEAYADTVILVTSEFGRSSQENELGGTDNGQAGAALVLGGAVNGGRVYGGWPDLVQAGPGPLPTLIDQRELAHAVAAGHFGFAKPSLAALLGLYAPGEILAGLIKPQVTTPSRPDAPADQPDKAQPDPAAGQGEGPSARPNAPAQPGGPAQPDAPRGPDAAAPSATPSVTPEPSASTKTPATPPEPAKPGVPGRAPDSSGRGGRAPAPESASAPGRPRGRLPGVCEA